MKQKLVIVGPLPPPYHGVTVSTSLVLANQVLRKQFDVEHVDTSDHRPGRNVGTWDVANVLLGVRAALRLRRSLRGRPGLVYLPLSQSAPGFIRDALLVRIAAARGWTIAAHLRGSDFRTFYDTSPGPLRDLVRRTLARVQSVAVMGESLRCVFEGLVSPERIAVVRNGTPEPHVSGFERDPSTVLFLSNLRRRKGVIEAVEAARLVAREHERANFVFVGEWEDPALERQLRARAAALNGRIQFRSPVVGEEKDRLLASSSILLFPPIEPEGHPRVVIEALAAGVPVVATHRGAIAETIVDGECGFVLPDAVPFELARRILRLLRDDELRRGMGIAARRRYLELFTQERADQALAQWLRDVALRP